MTKASIEPTAGHAPSGEHPPHLAHHFDTPKQQFDAGKLGIWVFLMTEVLFFGGLFCAYVVYRAIHPEIFIYAHQFLDKNLGALNTAVLIASSLSIAWAVRCAQCNQRRRLVACLAVTLALAGVFLGVKYVEYRQKWQHGLLWARDYRAAGSPAALEHAGSAPPGHATESLAAPPRDVGIFFSIYFVMTGLHGIHVIAGMGVITWVLVLAAKGRFSSQYYSPVDYTALYWHLVDMVWIYLFPLLYLIH
jgi:cytochrome c oxidase subunit III